MAARRRRRKTLGYYDLRRFVVVGKSGKTKRVYTNVVDALSVARRCSKNAENKPCKVLHGLPGTEKLIATCEQRRCRTTGGKAISMRKLYEAEQQGSGYKEAKARKHDDRGRKVRSIKAKGARKTKARKVF
jgi:hypothetical protein